VRSRTQRLYSGFPQTDIALRCAVCKCFATDPHQYSVAAALLGLFREPAASSSAKQH
jgi:hypothetical protein